MRSRVTLILISNNVRVMLSFKIADDNGDYLTQNLDTTIEEALALKKELTSVGIQPI